IALVVMFLAAAGCGRQDKDLRGFKFQAASPHPEAPVQPPANNAPVDQGDVVVVAKDIGDIPGAGRGAAQKPDGGAAPAQPVPRKIIYNAEVQLVVEDLPNAEDLLKQLLRKYDGFIAQSELTGSAGARRSGHWRLRIPAEGFDDFLSELVKLGVPERNKTDSQDVTDQ